MKKLLPAVVAFALIATACGPSGEEKEVQQQEAEAQVDEKVNEIMDQLEASGNEATEEMATDSAATEAEHDHSHEGGDGHGH